MVELTALHVSDIHDRIDKLTVLEGFLQDHGNNIDITFITGDFVQAHVGPEGTATRIQPQYKQIVENDPQIKKSEKDINDFLLEQNRKGNFDTEIMEFTKELSTEDKETFKDILKKRNEAYQRKKDDFEQIVNTEFEKSYKDIAEPLSRIRSCTPIYGVLGNHDLTLAYPILSEYVTFLETAKKKTVKGESGVEFILQGDLNTWEVPPFYSQPGIDLVVSDHLIKYISGHSLKGTEDEEEKKEISEYQKKEKERLGEIGQADIWLTHKTPRNEPAFGRDKTQYRGDVTGNICLEYTTDKKSNVKAIYGGHMHSFQVGNKGFKEFNQALQEAKKTTTIDDVEVPVIYLEKDETWEMCTGTEFFTVTEFDKHKNIERQIVYQFTYD